MYHTGMDNTKTNPDSHLANYDPEGCYFCDRPKNDCACELDPNGPLPQSACAKAALKIVSLSAGEVERVGFVQPANTELRKVWGNGVYRYELRPAGYRTQYEREIEAEAMVSDTERI